MSPRPSPFALIILDGWGHREDSTANAIAKARIPHWDFMWKNFSHTLVEASGHAVGLPDGQMGNSEVGHLNIGAGRVVYQDLTRIDAAIATQEFLTNIPLCNAIDNAIRQNKAIHVLGLVSPGGVHSHEKHFYAFLALAAARFAKNVFIHAFLDGRDTPPQSAAASLAELNLQCQKLQCGEIASIIGRYYAMDRDKRWERIQTAYDLLTHAKADFHAEDALTALQMAYDRGETDEFVKATSIHALDTPAAKIEPGDTVIFMNFRADRARELCEAFVSVDFSGFKRPNHPPIELLTLTQYDALLRCPVAFPPQSLNNTLGQHLSSLGLKQLRIAETEKYAHVTFFFNGGIEQPNPNEDRLLIPSPKVATYDLQPAMSAAELTTQLIAAIHSKQYDVIICNYANPDMLGHTGNMAATVAAIEVIDGVLQKVFSALQEVGGAALITADHGNAELMFDETTGQPHTAHTSEQVPLLYIGEKAHIIKENAILADIAPTMLSLMGLPIPAEMTGDIIFATANCPPFPQK
jgi:2,3-bisphosphoglycerate-independent phosphoglycerate mutase